MIEDLTNCSSLKNFKRNMYENPLTFETAQGRLNRESTVDGERPEGRRGISDLGFERSSLKRTIILRNCSLETMDM